MPRPPLPSDDLYARLGVPLDASVEAIEIAWRGLLRRHHPDVAGDEGLELAKRINVAHDWLSDPVLRARYDRERGLRHAVGPRGDGRGPWHARGPARGPLEPEPTRPAGRRRAADPEVAIRRFLERIESLTATDIDRLSLAEPPPIAFGATIRRFLPPAQRASPRRRRGTGRRGPPGGRRAGDHPRRDRRLRDRARPRLVPRRAAHRAIPESRARAPDPRLGCGRGSTTLRAERRGRRGLPGPSQRAGRGRPRAAGRDGRRACRRGSMAGWADARGRRRSPRVIRAGGPRRRGRDPGRSGRPGTAAGSPCGRAPRPPAGPASRLRAGDLRRPHRPLASMAPPDGGAAPAGPPSGQEFLSVIRSMTSATSSHRSMVSSRTL